eukprot:1161859-Pelagomonas_calceolata.AAC.27
MVETCGCLPLHAGPGAIAQIEPWRIGTVTQLTPDEDIPLVGVVRPGHALLTVEAGMFRAPAAPHQPQASDFLLVRCVHGLAHTTAFGGPVTRLCTVDPGGRHVLWAPAAPREPQASGFCLSGVFVDLRARVFGGALHNSPRHQVSCSPSVFMFGTCVERKKERKEGRKTALANSGRVQ